MGASTGSESHAEAEAETEEGRRTEREQVGTREATVDEAEVKEAQFVRFLLFLMIVHWPSLLSIRCGCGCASMLDEQWRGTEQNAAVVTEEELGTGRVSMKIGASGEAEWMAEGGEEEEVTAAGKS